MIPLIRAEFVRFFSRRSTWIAIAMSLVLIILMLASAYQVVQPLTEAEKAQATRLYEDELKQYEQHKDDGFPKPQLEHFVRTVPPLATMLSSTMGNSAFLALLACVVIGSSLIGAEFNSGAIANLLSFAPNRNRVWAAKGIVTGLGTAFIGATLVAISALGMWGIYVVANGWGSGGGTGDSAQVLLRATALAVIGGLLGFAIVAALRHTAAGIGIVLGFAAFGSALLGILMMMRLSSLARYLPDANLNAIINGKHEIWLPPDVDSLGNVIRENPPIEISLAHGAIYWAVFLSLLLAASWWVFRRRDIA